MIIVQSTSLSTLSLNCWWSFTPENAQTNSVWNDWLQLKKLAYCCSIGVDCNVDATCIYSKQLLIQSIMLKVSIQLSFKRLRTLGTCFWQVISIYSFLVCQPTTYIMYVCVVSNDVFRVSVKSTVTIHSMYVYQKCFSLLILYCKMCV